MNTRKSENDPKISKSWESVNSVMRGESDFYTQQREAAARAKRADELRQQANDVMSSGPGGRKG